MQSDQTLQTPVDTKNISFGARLKMAREAMGLERKDAAAQLRLNEKYLVMMEKDRFAADLPLTFARGYLKTYAKFLQIPEFEIKKALEMLTPNGNQMQAPMKNLAPISTGRYFTQLFTYLVIFTMIGLAGAWWYTHPDLPNTLLAQSPFNFTKSASNKADVATAAKAVTSQAVATQEAPANVPISTTTQSVTAPSISTTDNTDAMQAPVQAPGTMNAPNTTASTSQPINAKDVDDSIAPVESQVTSTHAAANKPAYMTNTNDDPLKNANTQDNDTE